MAAMLLHATSDSNKLASCDGRRDILHGACLPCGDPSSLAGPIIPYYVTTLRALIVMTARRRSISSLAISRSEARGSEGVRVFKLNVNGTKSIHIDQEAAAASALGGHVQMTSN